MEQGGSSSHFLTPTRRASAVLLSKSRPTTSGDPYASRQPTARSPSNYNRFNRFSYNPPPTYTNSDWLDIDRAAMDHEPVLIVDGRINADPFSQLQFFPKPTTPQVRRTSSFAESFKNGLHNVRSLGRRMSLTIRGKPRILKEDLAPSNMFEQKGKRRSTSNADKFKTIQPFPVRDEVRPASRTRRVPSMPILHNYRHSQLMSKPDQNTSDLRLHSHRRTSIIVRPDVLQGGAGARASAAARNAELQLARQTPLPPYQSRPTSPEDELRDDESGIGIVTDDLDGLTLARHRSRSPHVAKKNPADVLPGELLEHILTFLNASDLLEVELVSKQWKNLSRSQTVWRQVFFREYAPSRSQRVKGAPPTAGLGKNKPGQDFKKLYEVRRRIDNRWTSGKAAAIYLDGHKDSVYCVQFDEDKIITGSRDNTIRVWDARTYQCVRKLGPPNNPRERNQLIRPDVSPQGNVPFITETASPVEPHLTQSNIWHQASVLCLQYDQDILVTGSSDFTCIVWSVTQNYKPLFRLTGHKAGVLDVCINATTIVTCSKDTTIKIWDRFTGELLRTLTGHRGPVNAVQLRGNLLASASGDGMSKLWQLDTGHCIKEFHSKERGLACVEFSEDGRSIFAGGNDHVIYEYNTVSGDVKRELQGHKDLVRSLHLDTANSRLISGSYDHSIRVWNAHNGESDGDGGLQLNLEGWTSSWMLAAKSNYRKIACASQDGRVVIVDFGYGIDSVDLVEARC